MKEPISAGLVAGAIAVTAGGGVSIVAEGWPEAMLVALAVGERLRPRRLVRGSESRGARRGRAVVLRRGRGLLPRPRGRPDRRRRGAGDRGGRRPVLRRPVHREDVYLTHSLDGATYLDFGRKGGCTAAFMVWGRKGRTLRDLTFRRCSVERSYHHGFSLNLAGASEGGGFADILYDQCHAIAAGSGLEGGGRRDWSCGFDIPDAGDVERMTVRDCWAVDCWQDGFHLDGSWDGHRQRAGTSSSSGATRSPAASARGRCRPSSTSPASTSSPPGSSTARPSAAARPASSARTRRPAGSSSRAARTPARPTASSSSTAGTGRGSRASSPTGRRGGRCRWSGTTPRSEVEIRNFAGDGRPVLLGVTERLEFVDAPGHVEDLARYRARGYAMKGNRIAIVTDRPMEVVEVHPPSVNSVDMAGVTVEYYPPRPAMG